MRDPTCWCNFRKARAGIRIGSYMHRHVSKMRGTSGAFLNCSDASAVFFLNALCVCTRVRVYLCARVCSLSGIFIHPICTLTCFLYAAWLIGQSVCQPFQAHTLNAFIRLVVFGSHLCYTGTMTRELYAALAI